MIRLVQIPIPNDESIIVNLAHVKVITRDLNGSTIHFSRDDTYRQILTTLTFDEILALPAL